MTVDFGYLNYNLYPRFVGDINNDGVIDLIGFFSTGVQQSLAIP